MPFDWNNFLALAEALAAKTDEASQRTAISRAYYCVFNLAFARAEMTAGRRPRDARSHQWCWEQYSKTLDPTCAQLGVTGDRMKRLRVAVDYKASMIPRLEEEAQRILLDAHKFLADLATLDHNYPRP
jgi:uncharacterized protein (UPF0332 family)